MCDKCVELEEMLAAAVEGKRVAEEQRDEARLLATIRDPHYHTIGRAAALQAAATWLDPSPTMEPSPQAIQAGLIAQVNDANRERDAALSRVRELEQQAVRVQAEQDASAAMVLSDVRRIVELWRDKARHADMSGVRVAGEILAEIRALAPAAGGDAK